MAWKGVITNAGAALLDQWALGGTLTITSAATGTGTVSESALIAQTSLVSGKQTASIISSEKLSTGIKLKLQITAPRTTYLLQQYGVWASLSGGTAVLLALFQNPTGITIPSSTESPDFVYTLFALMKISNTGEFTVTVDTSALVSQSTLEEAMATKVDKVSGKGLSTNDYTTAEKEKLAGIEAQANKYTHPTYTARTGKPTANLTPGFGETVTVSQIKSDGTGHVTAATDRTITIPSATATASAAGLMSAADKGKLDGVAAGAEVNQNAFSNVKVDSTTVAADGKTDTLELAAGTNITLTPDATNDKVTIATKAEVNQNAFSNVKVGSTTVAADAKTDTLELVAGSNVTLTADATNDKVTIAATDTTYSSKAAASGGTAVSLVTTGEKYNWNTKAEGSHTHDADDIASGSLPIARGGTGQTAALAAITALGGASIASVGTAIPEGADLNTYTTAGTYYSENNTRSKTLVNAPFTDLGFKLFVVRTHTGNRVMQLASHLTTFYVRHSANTSAASPTWTDWISWSTSGHSHGAGDITSGTLPVARGGTGQTNAEAAASALIGGLSSTVGTNNVTDDTLIATSAYNGETGTWYRRSATKLWGYIKGKADAVYAAISHTHGISEVTDLQTTLNNKVDKVSGKGLSTNDFTSTLKTKLDGVATGAEVNQNAFSNVKVGSTTVAADGKTDTLELVAGSNVTLTPDATNDKVTIAATDTTYSSKAAASGGTAVSLVTTGEKYNWNSKAESSHNHDAGDITSGTLPVARGGTGATAALAAITALGGASIASAGTAIPEGADMNAYTTAGTYSSANSTRSKTLVNAPTADSGFKLYVLRTYSTTKLLQVAISSDFIYSRSCYDISAETPSWTNWVRWSTSGHKHVADDITSGTLAAARLPDATSSAKGAVKLGASGGAAAYEHSHDAGDITSGTLPAARGGTGQTSASEAASALNQALSTSTSDVQDATLFVTSSVAATTTTWYKRPAYALWNYIKGKADAVYADAGHDHDAVYYKLTSGTVIGSDADLNDAAYRTPGNYYCSPSATAATVKNTPGCDDTTLVNPDLAGFRLWVGYASGTINTLCQELRVFNTGRLYYRYYTVSTSKWSSWYLVQGTASALLSGMNATGANGDVKDETLIATSYNTGETGTWYRRTAVKFWNYIKGKADAVYAAISHSHDAGDITSGTLPVARGGTGKTTATTAASAFVSALASSDTDVRDTTLFSTSAVAGETNTWYKRPASALWNYIKGKADDVYSALDHTHTTASLGGGYATCTTAAATFAKTATLSGYTLKTGGIVVVKFTKGSTCVVSDDNPDVTLNINSTGAKPIKYRDAALDNNTIKSNNLITFVYDGTNYVIISSNRGVANLVRGATASAAGGVGLVPQPAAGDDGKYLRGDGTWSDPASHLYVTAGQKSGTTLGECATAEGKDTTVTGKYSHSEGVETKSTAQGAHSEGYQSVAEFPYTHAEGYQTKAYGSYGAHSEGEATEAYGTGCHAEGVRTIAASSYGGAHSEGTDTKAYGNNSHCEGEGTRANGDNQHVFGKYNVSNTTDVEIVGWGTSSAQKNIRTLDESGNMTIAGTLTQSSDARLKDVQGEIPDVSGIRAVRFKWNDTNGEHDDRDHIGYLAQEVEQIAPYLVGDDSNGYKSLDYIALLVAKVEMLERKVAELEGRG